MVLIATILKTTALANSRQTEAARQGLEAILDHAWSQADYMTSQGLARALEELWDSLKALDASDASDASNRLVEQLKARLIAVGMPPDSLISQIVRRDQLQRT